MDFTNVSVWLAFIAGIASFLSPCVFALVPAYIGYLGGRSAASGATGRAKTWVTFSHGLAFVLGFSLVFISLGVATSALGGFLYELRTWLTRIGGAVIVIFGLHMTGIIRIPFLEYDLRSQSTPDRNLGYLASFMMGVFFSAGWSPCIGPILGAILTLTLSGGSISQGVVLLTAYSAGLAIPFLIASIEIGLITSAIQRYGKVMRYVEIGMGVLLIIIGVMLFFGRFETLAGFGSFFGVFEEVKIGRYLLIGVVVLVILGLLPAFIAARKGRRFLDWYFFGVGLFPVALPMAIFIKPISSDLADLEHYSEGDGESEVSR
ncbi:MAG: cytochrome c biogenesis protein CcdA [Chloroflexota bacterium]|nr:cytochrome c biogenesis protein CcdA [Chloroflexota bacterium]